MGEADKTATLGRERLLTPIFLLIVAATLFTFLVGQGTNAGTSVYLERTGGELWLAGIGALCFSAAAGVARLVSGPVCDRGTRQVVIICGAALMLIGCLGPITDNTGGFFILWRLLQGGGFSAATTALATATADVLPLSRMGEGIGYYGLGQAVSMAIGPALAIFLVSTDPPSNFYLGCASCSALALALAILIRYERAPSALPPTSAYRQRAERDGRAGRKGIGGVQDAERGSNGLARLLSGVFEPKALHGAIPVALMCSVFSFNIFYMGVFGNAIGAANPGLYYTVCAIVMIVIRFASGRFMDRAAPLLIMGVGAGAGVIAFAMLFVSCTFATPEAAEMLFYGSGAFVGLCMGLGIPVNQTVAVKMSPAERWGAANGLFQLAIDVANGMLSVLWGFLAAAVGYSVITICIMVLAALSFFAAVISYPKEQGSRAAKV